MHKSLCLSLALLFSFCVGLVSAQTLWTGPTISITKANSADWTLTENQDSLTANVILTRANGGGLFNIRQESEFSTGGARPSPLDTEWAVGTLADDLSTLTFDTWANINSGSNGSFEGRDMVVHLLTDDIYFDIKITEWTRGGGGGSGGLGGFAYERSTDPQISSTSDARDEGAVYVFPNPTTDYLQIIGLSGQKAYSLHTSRGEFVEQGFVEDLNTLDVSSLSSGVYYLRFENNSIKFIKE